MRGANERVDFTRTKNLIFSQDPCGVYFSIRTTKRPGANNDPLDLRNVGVGDGMRGIDVLSPGRPTRSHFRHSRFGIDFNDFYCFSHFISIARPSVENQGYTVMC